MILNAVNYLQLAVSEVNLTFAWIVLWKCFLSYIVFRKTKKREIPSYFVSSVSLLLAIPLSYWEFPVPLSIPFIWHGLVTIITVVVLHHVEMKTLSYHCIFCGTQKFSTSVMIINFLVLNTMLLYYCHKMHRCWERWKNRSLSSSTLIQCYHMCFFCRSFFA